MVQGKACALIPANWQVPELFRRRLGDQAGRQRVMNAEGHLLLVLHAPPDPDSPEREGRFFWRDRDGKWSPSGASPGQPGVGDLLSEYERELDDLQTLEEEAKTARQYFDLLNRLSPIARAARNLHDTLQQAREAEPNDRSLILWRDRAYVISRTADLQYGDAKNALDFAVLQRAEEEAALTRRVETAAYRLNVLVACFFPVATLASIFGANLRNGFEDMDAQHGPWPLLILLSCGLLAGLILALFINRKP